MCSQLKCESTPLIGNSLHHRNATSDQAFCISCVHSVFEGLGFKFFTHSSRQTREISKYKHRLSRFVPHNRQVFVVFSLHPSRVPFAVYSLMCQRSVICIV